MKWIVGACKVWLMGFSASKKQHRAKTKYKQKTTTASAENCAAPRILGYLSKPPGVQGLNKAPLDPFQRIDLWIFGAPLKSLQMGLLL